MLLTKRKKYLLTITAILLALGIVFLGCGTLGNYQSGADEADGDRWEPVYISSAAVDGKFLFIASGGPAYYILSSRYSIAGMVDVDLETVPRRGSVQGEITYENGTVRPASFGIESRRLFDYFNARSKLRDRVRGL